MQFFSALGVAFGGLTALTEPPTPLVRAGAQIGDEFEAFAKFVRQRTHSLCKAMDEHVLKYLLVGDDLPSGKSLNQAIVDRYLQLESDVSESVKGSEQAFFDYVLHLYITIFHFSAWYCVKISGVRLDSDYRDYIKAKLKKTYFSGDIRLAKSFVNDSAFDALFEIKLWLSRMNIALGDIMTNTGGRYDNIITREHSAAKLTPDEAEKFRFEVLAWLRDECFSIISRDVRSFLGTLAKEFSDAGGKIEANYSSLSLYATGEGEQTNGMFGLVDYGILFMRYGLVRGRPRPGRLFINAIPLLNAAERDMAVTFFYFGLNQAPTGDGPGVQVRGFKGPAEQEPPKDKSHLLKAVVPGSHIFARTMGSPTTVRTSDLGDNIDAMQCDLYSKPGLTESSPFTTGDEMVFLIFKHRLKVPPPQQPPSSPPIFLSSNRPHADNEYQKLLSPSAGTMPAVVEPAVFAQPQADLAKLAATLAADSGFEFDVVIEGLGVGEPLPTGSYAKGARALTKADDQSDRAPGPGYGALRHDYGWFEWLPGSSGGTSWLTGHVTGFVSPLRCTFEKYFTPAKKALLDTMFKHRMVLDKKGRPIYNCLLSAFRAFSLFHAMVEQLSNELNALGTPGAATAKQKIVDYLKNEASLEVVLPTGMKMSGGPLKHDDIVPFY